MIAFAALLACEASEKQKPAPSPAVSLPASSSVTVAASAAPIASSPPATPPSVLLLPAGGRAMPAASAQRVLHIGDSMVPLVGNYLRQVFRKDGRRYEIVSIPSSSTLSWARENRLRDAMYRYDPEVVIISLGSNELFDPNPERRAPSIRQIVAETRGRPCLWIGPPAWKKDKGFLSVLKANVAPCQYFDSEKLELDRMADGRHPSWTGSYAWAAAVWNVLGGTEPIPAGNVDPARKAL